MCLSKKLVTLWFIVLLFVSIGSNVFLVNVVRADDPVGQPFDYWYAPSNSFGISETKTVNYSYFKHWLNDNFGWRLEYKRYSYSDWYQDNSYMNITRVWNESGFYKITITLTVPVQVYRIRFILYGNLDVLDYLEKDGSELWINYTINENDVYSLFFNYSDIKSIPNMVFSKGKVDNHFYFIALRDAVTNPGVYVFDPIFGTLDVGIYLTSLENKLSGSPYVCSNNGVANNISIYLLNNDGTYDYTGKIKCSLYYWYNLTYFATTEEKTLTLLKNSANAGWFVFNFTSTVNLVAGETYLLYGWAQVQDGTCKRYYVLPADGSLFEDSETYGTYPNPTVETTNQTNRNCSVYCSYTANLPWSNTCPNSTLNYPVNNSENICLKPTINISVYDYDGNVTTVCFWENTTGSYVLRQINTSVLNTTVYYNYSLATENSVVYYWMVTINDSICNVSFIYHFTTFKYTINLVVNMITPVNNSHVAFLNNITFNFVGNTLIFYNITLSNGLNWSGSCANDTIVVCTMLYYLVDTPYMVWVNASDNIQEANDTFGFTVYKMGMIPSNPPSSIVSGAVGFIGILGIIGFLMVRRRNKNEKNSREERRNDNQRPW
jgi:hypothetical protein